MLIPYSRLWPRVDYVKDELLNEKRNYSKKCLDYGTKYIRNISRNLNKNISHYLKEIMNQFFLTIFFGIFSQTKTISEILLQKIVFKLRNYPSRKVA